MSLCVCCALSSVVCRRNECVGKICKESGRTKHRECVGINYKIGLMKRMALQSRAYVILSLSPHCIRLGPHRCCTSEIASPARTLDPAVCTRVSSNIYVSFCLTMMSALTRRHAAKKKDMMF